jgi:hypothetical protein
MVALEGVTVVVLRAIGSRRCGWVVRWTGGDCRDGRVRRGSFSARGLRLLHISGPVLT